MHNKRDISNWNIKIILSVLIGAGIQNYSVQFACWVQQYKFSLRPIETLHSPKISSSRLHLSQIGSNKWPKQITRLLCAKRSNNLIQVMASFLPCALYEQHKLQYCISCRLVLSYILNLILKHLIREWWRLVKKKIVKVAKMIIYWSLKESVHLCGLVYNDVLYILLVKCKIK